MHPSVNVLGTNSSLAQPILSQAGIVTVAAIPITTTEGLTRFVAS